MRKLTCVGTAFLLLAAGSQATESAHKYTELPKGRRLAAAKPRAPQPKKTVRGGLAFYTDRPTFTAAHPGIPLETFAATNVAPDSVAACQGPFASTTNNACFSPGDIQPGISVVNGSGETLVVLTPSFIGVTCVSVGPNDFAGNGELHFSPPVTAVGLDLHSNVPDTFQVEVFGPGGSLGTTTANGTSPALFWGVDTSDAGGISRITFAGGPGSGELFCNVAFGQPTPVELQSFGIE